MADNKYILVAYGDIVTREFPDDDLSYMVEQATADELDLQPVTSRTIVVATKNLDKVIRAYSDFKVLLRKYEVLAPDPLGPKAGSVINPKEAMKMNKEVLLAVLKSDAVLYRNVLINAYRRLHNAYKGDPVAIRDRLVALFPKDEEAIDVFLANTGLNNELIRQVSTDPTEEIKNIASKIDRLGHKKLAERLLKSIKE